MTAEERITCDGCRDDITHKTSWMDYRFVLDTEETPTRPNYTGQTTTSSPRPIDKLLHFCCKSCIGRWATK